MNDALESIREAIEAVEEAYPGTVEGFGFSRDAVGGPHLTVWVPQPDGGTPAIGPVVADDDGTRVYPVLWNAIREAGGEVGNAEYSSVRDQYALKVYERGDAALFGLPGTVDL